VSLVRSLVTAALGLEPTAAPQTERRFLDLLALGGGGLTSTAGETVTPDSAATLSAVYGSWRILVDLVSTLPVDAYTKSGKDRRPADLPPWLTTPNPVDTTADLLGQVVLSLLIDGNAFIATYRQGGRITALEVVDPAKVEPEVKGGRLRFLTEAGDYGPQDIRMVRLLVLPGSTRGLSPLAAAKETMGLGLAAQKYGATFFGNGAIPGAVVEVPGAISDVGIRQMKAAWSERHQGADNANRLAVLTEGAKFTNIALPPDQAQFLETRRFQVSEVARIYGVPPHMLADASGSTSWGSGLAEQTTGFMQFSVRSFIVKVESLLTSLYQDWRATDNALIRLNVDAVLRGTPEARMRIYGDGLMNGIYNLDEVRAYEDLPPLPDGLGKDHRVPANLTVVKEPEPVPAALAAPAPGTEVPALPAPDASESQAPEEEPPA
jgi:HK97 family phage portal protein